MMYEAPEPNHKSFWTKKNKILISVAIILIVSVIVIIPSTILGSQTYLKDDLKKPNIMEFHDLDLSDIQQLKCSHNSKTTIRSGSSSSSRSSFPLLDEVDETFFYKTTNSCRNGEITTRTNHTITKGKWYTYVGDGSCLEVSTCEARIRVFFHENNDQLKCFLAIQDEFESDCSSLQIMETELGKTYFVFVDIPESNILVEDDSTSTKSSISNNADKDAFILNLQCSDCSGPDPPPSAPSWQEVAFPLEGDADGDYVGGSIDDNLSNSVVAMDESGTIVAYGAEMADNQFPLSGAVKVFQLVTHEDETAEWIQLGQTIEGDHAEHHLGTSVDLSSDGFTMVLGAPNFGFQPNENGDAGTFTKTGHARVFRYDVTSFMWIQIGSDLNVGKPQEMTGFDVSMNSIGTIVALGSRAVRNKTGRVRVFHWDESLEEWQQMGEEVSGDQTFSSDGRSIALSSGGLILAVGGPHYDLDPTNNVLDNGRVRVFKYDTLRATWILMGDPIIGNSNSLFGFSVDLSGDGMILAVGARWDSLNVSEFEDQIRSGSASVYFFNDITNTWHLFTSRLYGDESFEQLGVSVKLSTDGNIFAVGALGSKPSSFLSWVGGNYVKIYQLYVADDNNEGSGRIDDIGCPIIGDTGSRSGESIALSADGMFIAVGAALAHSHAQNIQSGNVRVFHFDESKE